MAQIAEDLSAQAALNGHQEPLDHLEEDADAPNEEQLSSYAKVTANNSTWSLELHLFREDNGADFRVEDSQVARLAYGRLHVPEGGMISFDHTYHKKLILELKADVKAADLNITQALEVRPGIKTRPVQNPSTERLIKIDYASIKMDNADIDEVMAIFGEVVRKTENVIFRAKEGDCKWEKMMDGVITPERNLLLKIHHNIPSFIIVKGTKLRVYYPGQPKTCGRCHRYWNTCPGGGKVDKCKKAKGEEKPLKTAFKQLVARIKKKEVNPQESSSPLIPMHIPDPDEIVFSGFKEDMAMPVFIVGWRPMRSTTMS